MTSPLEKLRELMAARGIDAYYVCICDDHNSEFPSAHFESTRLLSRFTGENCMLVITASEAMLWTDGRFFIQAEAQMDPAFKLVKMGIPGEPTVTEYLQKALPEGGCLGFDGRLVFGDTLKKWKDAFAAKKICFAWKEDLIDLLWPDRPPMVFSKVWQLPLTYAGKSAAEKLSDLRGEMKKKKADTHILASLEDIAWLFNIRGDDIPYAPLVFSYTLITAEDAVLFAGEDVLDEELTALLAADGVRVRPYEEIYEAAAALPEDAHILMEEATVNMALLEQIPKSCTLISEVNPTTYMKCVKNETEIAGSIRSHIRDGVAMVRFSRWLKTHIGRKTITEISASDILEQFRREQPDNLGLSFETISAYGANAAMMHYTSTPETNAELKPEGFLLVDSGGHYLNGTTDITRTYVLGPITQEMKQHFTAVVRGMLNLGAAKFLEGCSGMSLDYLARSPMWELGIDYRCGTGHGVGFLSSVHEGPNSFYFAHRPWRPLPIELKPGMITTDEPGIYIDYHYGIRIENELLCEADEKNEYGQFLKFRHITYCPIDLDGIDPQYMSEREIRLLNEYHEMVYETLKEYLEPEDAAWLRGATRPLTKR